AEQPSGSGLLRSADGGKTWTELTPEANKGFPAKPYGRLAVAIAPSQPKRVYAFVESPHSALYVSDDGGQTWDERDRSQWMVWRPVYFRSLVVGPAHPAPGIQAGRQPDHERGRGQELRRGRRLRPHPRRPARGVDRPEEHPPRH